jgi:Domain of unknown function (DUF4388)
MAMLGNLSEFSLPDILQMFERSGKTGQLSVWAPTGIYRVWFYQGRVIASISPESQHRLKQLLVDCQAIDGEMALHLDTLTPLNEPLGSYLRKQSLIAPPQLAMVFRQQLKLGLYDLFSLQSGQFRFGANVPLPYEEMTGISKGSMEAAMEGLRQVESLAQNLKDLPQPDSTLIKMASELPLLKLSSLEWGIWERISVDNPVRAIAQQLQTDLLEVRKACLRLIQVGLLEEIPASLANAPSAASLPSPRALALDQSAKSIAQKTSKGSETEAKKPPINMTLLSRLTTVLKAMR